MAVTHLSIKFGTDISFQSTVIDILPKLKMAAARGVARIFEWGDERRRREKRGAEGAEGGRVRGGGYLTLKWCILVRISGILTHSF